MLITKEELVTNRELNISSNDEITNNDLCHLDNFIKINSMQVNINVKYVPGMDLAVVSFKVKGSLKLRSTRSLVPVDVEIDDHDQLTYLFSKNDNLEDESIIEVKDQKIQLHDEIVSLIITSIPIKIIAKDEPESFSGDSWEVISEDQYQQRKDETIDSRFNVLNDFDVE